MPRGFPPLTVSFPPGGASRACHLLIIVLPLLPCLYLTFSACFYGDRASEIQQPTPATTWKTIPIWTKTPVFLQEGDFISLWPPTQNSHLKKMFLMRVFIWATKLGQNPTGMDSGDLEFSPQGPSGALHFGAPWSNDPLPLRQGSLGTNMELFFCLKK